MFATLAASLMKQILAELPVCLPNLDTTILSPRRARKGKFGVRASDINRICEYAVIRAALALGWTDFEDAVCVAAGQAARCDAVVTRDPEGFPLPAGDALCDPEVVEALHAYESTAGEGRPARRASE